MKLSSRKKLLKESDEILSQIKTNIRTRKLNEVHISDILTNIAASIIGNMVKAVKTGRQSWLYYKMPYIMGLDLVNNANIKVDRSILVALDNIIKDIINDIKNSAELKTIMSDLRNADNDITLYRGIIQNYSILRNKGFLLNKNQLKDWEESHEKYKKAKENFNNILLEKASGLIKYVITRYSKYKNFDQIVLDKLQSGISGVSSKEINQIRDKYFKTLAQRVADYIKSYEYKKLMTGEEDRRYRQLQARHI